MGNSGQKRSYNDDSKTNLKSEACKTLDPRKITIELLTYVFSSISYERRQTSTLNLKNSSNKNVFTKGRRRLQNESFSKNHNFAVLFKTAQSFVQVRFSVLLRPGSLEKMPKKNQLFIHIYSRL